MWPNEKKKGLNEEKQKLNNIKMQSKTQMFFIVFNYGSLSKGQFQTICAHWQPQQIPNIKTSNL